MDRLRDSRAAIRGVRAAAYRIPTDAPESDGSFAWRDTTLVVAEVEAGGVTGIGYGYGHRAEVPLIETVLAEALSGRDPLHLPGAHAAMRAALRNLGTVGPGAMALSPVDAALWDAKGKLLGQSVARLLGCR